MMTYPGFQALPRGVKRMLLESESFFFGEARTRTEQPAPGRLTIRISLAPKRQSGPTRPMPASGEAWRN
jgi:hypothetical protein